MHNEELQPTNQASASEQHTAPATVFASSTPTPSQSEPKKDILRDWIDFFRDLVIILIIFYFIPPFQIRGSSMESSYHDNEIILVNKLSYFQVGNWSIGGPTRGDVVIFRPHVHNGKEYYIKRVVGVPGDTLKFQDGEVFLAKNGSKQFIQLNEDYLSATNKGKTYLPLDVKTNIFVIPEGEYFLMGDNRNNSSDSRSCFYSCSMTNADHFARRSDIIGKVLVDFGYIKILDDQTRQPIFPQVVYGPRLFSTPSTWTYPELSTTGSSRS